ncbi:hypothetical protein OG439_20170 [Amycolatopsis sp. NBC_01307]|uniref:hypothetical protein n=1 Tax=Amycolatopsis sp. NBC_01307 TaxID=2903561 RepID=UPI002E1492BF|nr:hypothetical protein OG439_20170 [Amycolatopsis sp. NBC_01307]
MEVLPAAQWWVLALIGVAAGGMFGAIFGPMMARERHVMWQASGEDLTWPQLKAASRASRSGRAPADPRVRVAAIRLAVYQLAQHRRRRRSMIIAYSVGVGFFLFDAAVGNWFGLLGAGCFTILGGVFLTERLRLQKALLRLREESPARNLDAS